ncbi:hypothetical protein [Flavobacterium selenitireducens]|uniref:hypothetical protein n=1 Tax=Flavobacterium selenitireducens TaxID=2722704 RepID=UPI00168BA226|nr:hypothetical protein [Flavobacterium selenitireducens]MBD3581684.1 hypothetical protein [Flavobacterium selenitireducens]
MKKTIALVAFLATSLVSAQKATQFEIKIEPLKKYTLETVSLNNINMDVPTQGPMTILQETKGPFVMTTAKAAADGSVPVELKYGDVTVKQTYNGQPMEQKSPASGMTVVGKFDGSGKFVMESVKGDNVTDEIKTMLNTMLESGLKQINFPKKALAIGDSFEDTTPLQIPLGQMGTLSATIKSTYKLTKVENGIGFFDSAQTLTMDKNDATDIKATATGTGTGKVEVSIADKYIKKNGATMTMDMTIEVSGMKMDMKSTSTSSTTATVSKL